MVHILLPFLARKFKHGQLYWWATKRIELSDFHQLWRGRTTFPFLSSGECQAKTLFSSFLLFKLKKSRWKRNIFAHSKNYMRFYLRNPIWPNLWHNVWKSQNKVSFNIASVASYIFIMSGQKPIKNFETGHFGVFLKTWSFWSTNITRQVNFNRTKIGGKGQKFKWDILVIFKHCAMGLSSSFSSHFSWLSKWQLFEILVLFPLWLKKFRRFLELGCFYVIHLGFKTPRVSASHWLKSFKSWQVILSLAHFVKSRIPL